MDENSYIEFTEPVVIKLEGFADTLETLRYESDDWITVISLFFLFIESKLNESNIYDYVYKTDITKNEKLGLQEEKKVIFDEINGNITKLQELPNQINEMYNQIKKIENIIGGIHEEMDNLSKINDEKYKSVEVIDHKISDIENFIEDSEWKVDLDSPEEKVFELIKNNLIILKKLKYGDI